MIEITGKENSQWVVDERRDKTMPFPLYIQKYGASHQTYAVTKYNSKYEADKALRVHLEKQANQILGGIALLDDINYDGNDAVEVWPTADPIEVYREMP